MIGVETLPKKKKGEHWTFDEGVWLKFTKPLFSTSDISPPSVYQRDSDNHFGFENEVSTVDPWWVCTRTRF